MMMPVCIETHYILSLHLVFKVNVLNECLWQRHYMYLDHTYQWIVKPSLVAALCFLAEALLWSISLKTARGQILNTHPHSLFSSDHDSTEHEVSDSRRRKKKWLYVRYVCVYACVSLLGFLPRPPNQSTLLPLCGVHLLSGSTAAFQPPHALPTHTHTCGPRAIPQVHRKYKWEMTHVVSHRWTSHAIWARRTKVGK